MPTIAIKRPPMHPAQLQIYRCSARFIVVAAGRRFGKTMLACVNCFKCAVTKPRAHVWWVAPTYKQAEVAWAFIKNMGRQIPSATAYESDMLLRLPNDSFIQVRSAHVPDNLRSQGLDYLVVDEAAFVSKDSWTKELRPALSDRQGRALFISTPCGHNWFYDLFNEAGQGGEWARFQFKTADNPYIAPEELESARRMISASEYAQEYEASFELMEGLIYPDFSRILNVSPDAVFDPAYPVYWSIDDGYTAPRAILLLQERPYLGLPDRIVVFDELSVTNQLVEQSYKELMNLGYPVPELAFYDPAAAQLAAELTARGIACWSGFNDIMQGIQVVRRFICDGNQQRRLVIHSRCDTLIEALAGYRFAPKSSTGDDPKPVHDQCSHAADALRYYIATKHLYEV